MRRKSLIKLPVKRAVKFYALEQLTNLHNNYRRAFTVDEHDMMLIQHEGNLSLLESFCPHAGYPMLESTIIGTNLRCQMHGYLFDVASGECTYAIEGPCRGLKAYELVYRQGAVGAIVGVML